jgi:hypothetical protein
MANTIFLSIVSIVVLGFPIWMIVYWLPKWDAIGIKKAKGRIAGESSS